MPGRLSLMRGTGWRKWLRGKERDSCIIE